MQNALVGSVHVSRASSHGSEAIPIIAPRTHLTCCVINYKLVALFPCCLLREVGFAFKFRDVHPEGSIEQRSERGDATPHHERGQSTTGPITHPHHTTTNANFRANQHPRQQPAQNPPQLSPLYQIGRFSQVVTALPCYIFD